ncbi:MAG: hypothetical protein PHF86_03935 [Candidatus Nanoarchaeia archaeon]|nr:hypothetical protein [Candidatus Nanoarchaeia archaeon]
MENHIVNLVEKVKEEGYESGVAQEVMSNRNYWRGFELAIQATTRDQFHELFNSQIVGEYIGPWMPKSRALNGAEAAVRLKMTSLTQDDINEVSNSYNNNI